MSVRALTIIIIGGGAAGYFAAIRAAEQDPRAKVIILERGREVLGKVKISGGGRCNLTHACWDPRELCRHYPRGERELLGPFHRFAPGDTVDWFEKRGVALKEEADGRMFPRSDSSQTIIDCLEEAAAKAGVVVLRQQRVEQLVPPGKKCRHWLVITPSERFEADRVLIATGSNAAIWKVLAGLGHTITPPVPSLFTFNIKDPRIERLAGIATAHSALAIEDTRLQASGPLLITHWGMSGPAILRLSAWGARQLAGMNYRFLLVVNWLDMHPEAVREQLGKQKREIPRRQISANPLFGIP